jgi:hypothetical protein
MIFGKVGRLGHGKSMRMVVDGIDLVTRRGGLEGRCWLAANIYVNPPPGIVFRQLPMDGFSDALAALMAETMALGVGLVVLVDEVDTVWDAHEWQTIRKSDRYRIKQSRKYGCDLIWSAQFVDQVDKGIRNITEEVELLRAIPNPSIVRRERGARPWFIRGQRFRPGAVRELVGDADKDKRLGWKLHRYRRDHERLYDTDELIVPVDQEALCAKHRRALSEALCPVCARADAPARGALERFALAAHAEPNEDAA